MKKKRKNRQKRPITEPLIFDLRQPEEWEQLKTDMPMEMYVALLYGILSCPCCSSHEKERAREHLEFTLQ